MKNRFLLLAVLFVVVFTTKAADIYFYQSKFSENVDSIKAGLKDQAAFDKVLASLDSLQRGLVAEKAIVKKKPLITEIQSVFAFLGEIAPGPKSYMLDINQKESAMSILGLTEVEMPDSTSCLPITKMVLWDTYNCFFVTNNSDSMMTTYKYNFLVEKKYSSYTGYVKAGVSVKCSRCIFESFKEVDVVFDQELCEQTLGVVRYIQPEIIQPKIDEYPEPDYLSPQQKKALKAKLKKKLKKEKAKTKKRLVKEKKKKKKEMAKLRMQKKSEAMAVRDAKKEKIADKRALIGKAKKIKNKYKKKFKKVKNKSKKKMKKAKKKAKKAKRNPKDEIKALKVEMNDMLKTLKDEMNAKIDALQEE